MRKNRIGRIVPGAAFALVLAGTAGAFVPEFRLAPLDFDAGDRFGSAVDFDGTYGVVGAAERNDRAGSVFVFVQRDGIWYQQAELEADKPADNDTLGWSVAIDGDTIVAGAAQAELDGNSNAGKAVIYRWTDAVWEIEQTIDTPEPGESPEYGTSVSISGDTIVVGAPREDGPANSNSGAAYVYTRAGTTWTLEQKLEVADPHDFQFLGYAVGIDGDTAVISARGDSERDGGAAYVFTRDNGIWSVQQKIFSDDIEINDAFGESVAICGDAIVVGAYTDEHSGQRSAGSAYVFVRNPATWTQQEKLIAATPGFSARFGSSVDIQGDHVVVGARTADGPVADDGVGTVTEFTRDTGVWTRGGTFLASDGVQGDSLGTAVAVRDGVIFAGAGFADDPVAGVDAGAAYVFDTILRENPPEAFIVPDKVTLNLPVTKKTPDPGFTAKGRIDTGASDVDLTSPGTLMIGSRQFDIPGLVSQKDGKSFLYEGNGVTFEITPDKNGSSDADFDLTFDGDLTGDATADGELLISYANVDFEAECTVVLAEGSFKLEKAPGNVTDPPIDVRKVKLKLKKPGKDTLTLDLGFASDGNVPANAPVVSIVCGTFAVTVPADQFKQKGDKWQLDGKFGGLTKLVIDYAKGTIDIKGKKLGLGDYPDEPFKLFVSLTLDGDENKLLIRVFRKKKNVKY